MIAFDMLISIILAIAAAAVGLINAVIWMQLAKRVSDHRVKSKFMYFALATLLLASGEVVFAMRKSRGLTGGTFEYIQYGFIIAGFLAFLLSAKTHLKVSETYGFTTHALDGADARSAEKAIAKQRPKGKKRA